MTVSTSSFSLTIDSQFSINDFMNPTSCIFDNFGRFKSEYLSLGEFWAKFASNRLQSISELCPVMITNNLFPIAYRLLSSFVIDSDRIAKEAAKDKVVVQKRQLQNVLDKIQQALAQLTDNTRLKEPWSFSSTPWTRYGWSMRMHLPSCVGW